MEIGFVHNEQGMALCYRNFCDISLTLFKIKVNSYDLRFFFGASCLFCIVLNPLNHPEGHFTHIWDRKCFLHIRCGQRGTI